MENINSHVETPFLYKDGVKWYIQFWYKNSLGERKPFKRTHSLNEADYLKKVKGQHVEIDKTKRKDYANALISNLKSVLKTHYFNPETRAFEITDKSELPFKSYLTDYVDYYPRKKRSEKTKNLYSTYNNVIIDFLDKKGLKSIALNKVDRELVEDFLALKEQEGKTSTRDNYLTYLKGVYKYVVEYLELLPKSPIRHLNSISNIDSNSNRAYSISEFKEYLERAKQKDYYLYLLCDLMFTTLRRPSELLSIKFKDIDFNKGTIDFEPSEVKTRNKVYSTISKNILKQLKAIIPNDILPDYYLFGYNERINRRYQKLIFGENRTPLSHFQDAWKTLKEDKGYTLYSSKHTGVKYMIEELKWTDEDIIAYTGHKDTKILGRYARDAKRPKREYVEIDY